jgi:hypothetical protein
MSDKAGYVKKSAKANDALTHVIDNKGKPGKQKEGARRDSTL